MNHTFVYLLVSMIVIGIIFYFIYKYKKEHFYTDTAGKGVIINNNTISLDTNYLASDPSSLLWDKTGDIKLEINNLIKKIRR